MTESTPYKWFNEQKGYGFITPDAGGKDVFVHISAVERSEMRTLVEGQKKMLWGGGDGMARSPPDVTDGAPHATAE